MLKNVHVFNVCFICLTQSVLITTNVVSSNPAQARCLWLATGQWFSAGTPFSSTNKTDLHDITEILLKLSFNTITLTPQKKENCDPINLFQPPHWLCLSQTRSYIYIGCCRCFGVGSSCSWLDCRPLGTDHLTCREGGGGGSLQIQMFRSYASTGKNSHFILK
jgi:hypothetical protein